jgi:hypothetical protein
MYAMFPLFDSSNAVIGMAFFRQTLYCIASQLKMSKNVKKGRKKSTQNLKKAEKRPYKIFEKSSQIF